MKQLLIKYKNCLFLLERIPLAIAYPVVLWATGYHGNWWLICTQLIALFVQIAAGVIRSRIRRKEQALILPYHES